MLTTPVVLSALKYCGIAISGFATIWGLVSQTSYQDEHGNKRLTSAGQVAIFVAGLSAVIGMVAFGFEGIQQSNKVRDDLLRQQHADKLEAARDQLHDREQTASAEQNERNRFLMLRSMAQQAAAQAHVTRAISEANTTTLSEFGNTLFQIQRLSQPLRHVMITITGVAPLKNFMNDTYIKRVYAFMKSNKDNQYDDGKTHLERDMDMGQFWEVLDVQNGSSLFPNNTDENDWNKIATGEMQFAFFIDKSKLEKYTRGGSFNILQYPEVSDALFIEKPTKTEIIFDTLKNYVVIVNNFEFDWVNAKQSGRLISQIDLEHAAMSLQYNSRFPKNRGVGNGPDVQDLSSVERVCEIDFNTEQRDLERRLFKVLPGIINEYVIENIGSYRAPDVYTDLCSQSASSGS